MSHNCVNLIRNRALRIPLDHYCILKRSPRVMPDREPRFPSSKKGLKRLQSKLRSQEIRKEPWVLCFKAMQTSCIWTTMSCVRLPAEICDSCCELCATTLRQACLEFDYGEVLLKTETLLSQQHPQLSHHLRHLFSSVTSRSALCDVADQDKILWEVIIVPTLIASTVVNQCFGCLQTMFEHGYLQKMSTLSTPTGFLIDTTHMVPLTAQEATTRFTSEEIQTMLMQSSVFVVTNVWYNRSIFEFIATTTLNKRASYRDDAPHIDWQSSVIYEMDKYMWMRLITHHPHIFNHLFQIAASYCPDMTINDMMLTECKIMGSDWKSSIYPNCSSNIHIPVCERVSVFKQHIDMKLVEHELERHNERRKEKEGEQHVPIVCE
jgi:hypothetical protein